LVASDERNRHARSVAIFSLQQFPLSAICKGHFGADGGLAAPLAYISDAVLRRELLSTAHNYRPEGQMHDALFVNRLGLPIRPQSIRSKLRRYAVKVSVSRRVTPHMLGHTAATLLIETGVDIRFVQRLLGHSSIATTEIYTHVSDEALRSTIERANVLGTLGQQ
jgi:site-specific recombinase XerD